MEIISTLRELQYDTFTGEIIVRDGDDCKCVGYVSTVTAPDKIHTINLPRSVEIMAVQVYENSYGENNDPRLIFPENVSYGENSVEITFTERLFTRVQVVILYVCELYVAPVLPT